MSGKVYETTRSWTDDLPVCHDSGAGFSTNQKYREDGFRQEMHSFEDRSFHCRLDDKTYLYGVFDGQNGARVADFALQRITAEILLGQLSGKSTDDEVKEVLRQAFISVERGYLDSIDSLLAQRTSLQYDLPEGVSQYNVSQNYKHILDKLAAINSDLSVGTSAVVALLYNNRLYVANVGTCRALLCKTDNNAVMRVVQLSVDHNLQNEDEILRLTQLGLDMESIRQAETLHSTRCLGSYLLKGGYKENAYLSAALSEPVISDPEIHGGIEIDQSCRFLLLMSAGLYQSLQEATCTEADQVNKELAHMAVEQFRVQSTLPGVAQAVVDKAVRLHHDSNMQGSASSEREDITLLVRNFHFPLRHAIIKSPVAGQRNTNSQSCSPSSTLSGTNDSRTKIGPNFRNNKPQRPQRSNQNNLKSPVNPSVRFNPIVESHSNNSVIDRISDSSSENSQYSNTKSDSLTYSNNAQTDSSTSSDLYPPGSNTRFDRNKKIKAYVDFTEYYKNIEIAKMNGTLPEGIHFD